MNDTDTVKAGSAWGAATFAGADGSRQPTDTELGYAEYQVGSGGNGGCVHAWHAAAGSKARRRQLPEAVTVPVCPLGFRHRQRRAPTSVRSAAGRQQFCISPHPRGRADTLLVW